MLKYIQDTRKCAHMQGYNCRSQWNHPFAEGQVQQSQHEEYHSCSVTTPQEEHGYMPRGYTGLYDEFQCTY